MNKNIVPIMKNYIIDGLHLKRLDNHAQFEIFNNSDMLIFQIS